MMAVGYAQNGKVNAIADESEAPHKREVGPTITGIIEAHDSKTAERLVIEELAVPGPLKTLFQELYTTAELLHKLGEPDKSEHTEGPLDIDPAGVNSVDMGNTALYAIMGDHGAAGAIQLDEPKAPPASDDQERTEATQHQTTQNESDARHTAWEGSAFVSWPDLPKHALFKRQMAMMKRLIKKSGIGGRLIANPLWQFLPDWMKFLMDERRGTLLTVHPLGGCRMGVGSDSGVVDHFGRVFDPTSEAGSEPHKGLFVLDGSIIPTALGTNPGLTIAAMSLRALRDPENNWELNDEEPPEQATVARVGDIEPDAPRNPESAEIERDSPYTPQPTEVEIVERMSGEIDIDLGQGETGPRVVELTLRFKHKAIKELVAGNGDSESRILSVNGEHKERLIESQIRIFKPCEWQKVLIEDYQESRLEKELDVAAEFIAPLSGYLEVFSQENSRLCQRRWRGFWAWFANRGVRDIWQAFYERFVRPSPGVSSRIKWQDFIDIKDRLKHLWTLITHAGGVRTLKYHLDIGPASKNTNTTGLWTFKDEETGPRIIGIKRLTYALRSNPWRQLMDMDLTKFPCIAGNRHRRLNLDLRFLARRGLPLLRIIQQENQVKALSDVASLLAYVFRVVLMLHAWSFRLPDKPEPYEPRRLPGRVPGLPDPVITEIEVDRDPSTDLPIYVRLTRYPRFNSTKPPLVMIHGYSASGTSFAHRAVDPNLACFFWKKDGNGAAEPRDVWIVDLRTSCGMPTATLDSTFEQVACADIPAAIDYIWRQTERQKLDVFAHCMGSVMLSMAILRPEGPMGQALHEPTRATDPFCSGYDTSSRGVVRTRDMRMTRKLLEDRKKIDWKKEREQLPERIHKLVLCQVGPVVIFSPANVFRAFVTSYIRELLPRDYSFRPDPEPSLSEEVLDRALATLPYPEEEFDIENPPWYLFWRRAEFVGTRHRMDALYGRDFNANMIKREVLKYVDDFFGPLSIETVSQVMHFAREKTITDKCGRNIFVSPSRLQDHWNFSTLSIHGEKNGLSDVLTLNRMIRVLRKAGCEFETHAFPNFGHQDSLIGAKAKCVFKRVEEFLEKPDPSQFVARKEGDGNIVVRKPWAGPIFTGSKWDEDLPIRVGTSPALDEAQLIVLLPAINGEDRFVVGEGTQCDTKRALAVMRIFGVVHEQDSKKLRHQDWVKLNIPKSFVKRHFDGTLVLMIYHQNDDLDRAAYIEGIDSGPEDFYFYTPGDQPGADKTPHWMREVLDSNKSGTPGEARDITHLFDDEQQASIADIIVKRLSDDRKLKRAHVKTAFIDYSHLKQFNDDGCCFVLGSCQYPQGILDNRSAYASYGRICSILDGEGEEDEPIPRFMVMTGDQVYTDATDGLYDPRTRFDRYEKPYFALFCNRRVRDVLRRLPTYMLLDDHEIRNDWEPPMDETALVHGIDSYNKFQRPELSGNSGTSPRKDVSYSIEREGFDFYLLDTRTARMERTATTLKSDELINADQLKAIETWLNDGEAQSARPKFIATPAALLPRHACAVSGAETDGLRSDGWDGYPRSFHAMLCLVAESACQNVVFLSGDEHFPCFVTARILDSSRNPIKTFHSIHAPAMYAPFPFANSTKKDLKTTDAFKLRDENGRETQYSCQVVTEIPKTGDGFVIVDVSENAGGWQTRCLFKGADGSTEVFTVNPTIATPL